MVVSWYGASCLGYFCYSDFWLSVFVYGFLPLSVRKLGNSFEVVLVSFSTFSSGVSEMFE